MNTDGQGKIVFQPRLLDGVPGTLPVAGSEHEPLPAPGQPFRGTITVFTTVQAATTAACDYVEKHPDACRKVRVLEIEIAGEEPGELP